MVVVVVIVVVDCVLNQQTYSLAASIVYAMTLCLCLLLAGIELMPLPPITLASLKHRIVFTFLVPACPCCPGKRPLKGCCFFVVTHASSHCCGMGMVLGCVCVCMCVCVSVRTLKPKWFELSAPNLVEI